MGDRTRLLLTGLAAIGAVAVTVAAPSPWGIISFDDNDEEQVSIALPSLKNFDGVQIDGPDDVIVTQGNKFDVTIEGERGAERALNLYMSDGVLHVGRRGGHWRGDATVHVTMPGLKRLWLAGPGDMEVQGYQGKELKVLVSGPGDLEMGNLNAESIALSVTGPGGVVMTGTTNALDVNSTGPGDSDLDGLDAKTTTISVSGHGSVRAHASGNASLRVSGPGDARVEGTTQCQIVKSGPGDAECTT